KRLTEVEAKVIGPDSFAECLEQGEVLFVGDGALKCKDVICHPNARFQETFPLARHMAKGAQKAFDEGKFENLAYFEPFYLKDFIATVSKKNLW
ncbi:MAG: tRNA (adenosine(37)-N6)-threonylcarbamoyltransferase complex dimerization subunit type 1 TsaB, partial [Fibrobacter sp.]|nr:tRNA (adenosine(37)-N6)-threonylcarbamoyltransferase complex dimerization subunit type 1 TsaB [Fibrobacter sp.]